MVFTSELRRKLDQIRDYLYGGGYPDPLSNAEQLSFLFFFYMIESLDASNVRQSKALGRPYTSIFEGEWEIKNPINRPDDDTKAVSRDRMRWSEWAAAMNGQPLVNWVRNEVFPFFIEVGDRYGMNFMANARLAIDDPVVLSQVITLINGLHLEEQDPDTKGDMFEHVLRQIKQAGELGQFRTPRHIIRHIVELVNPKIGETIYDPAAGTAGFLVAAYEYIRLANSSEAGIEETEVENKTYRRGSGDKLSNKQWRALQTETFYGNDVDGKMVSLATMNLTLRGLPDVRIMKRNVLTTTMGRADKAKHHLPLDGYNVILANPPFSGRIDKDRIVEDVKIGTTTATEILFLKYMMDNLAPSGRCGVIVPEGILFGSTGAHKELRRMLIENNRVEAVLSLPGGVFQPYSGVKTSVLIFTRGKDREKSATERVMFLHADQDGFKLDASHDTPIGSDDLPGLIAAFNSSDEMWEDWQARDPSKPWTEKWWFAEADAIRAEGFNLSASRYRPDATEVVKHADPRDLLRELRDEAAAILDEVDALATRLAEVQR
ncbi:restriction endonuclease subunit S [Mesorhizobium sp. M00.F.Ca.ET.170.01.1.1]|nr:restriction endonuclease subunit S [Mesorhizobium sp. M00.F.Ca.ET.170.01.1.1]